MRSRKVIVDSLVQDVTIATTACILLKHHVNSTFMATQLCDKKPTTDDEHLNSHSNLDFHKDPACKLFEEEILIESIQDTPYSVPGRVLILAVIVPFAGRDCNHTLLCWISVHKKDRDRIPTVI